MLESFQWSPKVDIERKLPRERNSRTGESGIDRYSVYEIISSTVAGGGISSKRGRLGSAESQLTARLV